MFGQMRWKMVRGSWKTGQKCSISMILTLTKFWSQVLASFWTNLDPFRGISLPLPGIIIEVFVPQKFCSAQFEKMIKIWLKSGVFVVPVRQSQLLKPDFIRSDPEPSLADFFITASFFSHLEASQIPFSTLFDQKQPTPYQIGKTWQKLSRPRSIFSSYRQTRAKSGGKIVKNRHFRVWWTFLDFGRNGNFRGFWQNGEDFWSGNYSLFKSGGKHIS